ncbi:MAG: Hsp20/alpha crystallin family protein, partial [Candidatus Aenigmatarchaeota archaeon]
VIPMAERFGNREDPSWDIDRKCLDPLVQIRENEDEIIVTADLPCVEKDDIDVSVEEGSLKIKAQTKEDLQFEKWGGVHRRVKFNSFRKNIKLPSQVDPKEAEAKFVDGVLEVRLKKKEGKQIEIK